MDLVAYAKTELELAHLFDKDSDYGGRLGPAVLEIVAAFARQGHSGGSAELVTQLTTKLLRYEPLTPLTYGYDEWSNVSDISGSPLWQNKRDSRVFSTDGGKSHYRLGDEKAEA